MSRREDFISPSTAGSMARLNFNSGETRYLSIPSRGSVAFTSFELFCGSGIRLFFLLLEFHRHHRKHSLQLLRVLPHGPWAWMPHSFPSRTGPGNNWPSGKGRDVAAGVDCLPGPAGSSRIRTA